MIRLGKEVSNTHGRVFVDNKWTIGYIYVNTKLRKESIYMDMIWANRIKIRKDYWLRLKYIADLQGSTREELINKIFGLYLDNIKIKVEAKHE